jgi:hypothetical protein
MSIPARLRIIENESQYDLFGMKLVSLKSKRAEPSAEYQLAEHKRKVTNFINMLHDPRSGVSYSLRSIVIPNLGTQTSSRIEIALLVRLPVQDVDVDTSDHLGKFIENVKILLGGIFSIYAWEQISSEEELNQFLNPLDWTNAFTAEIRRREETVYLDTLIPHKHIGFMGDQTGALDQNSPASVYYVHPFSPPTRGFETLLNTLMQAKQKIVLTASLSPTNLTDEEIQFFQDQISFCESQTLTGGSVKRVQQLRAQDLEQALLRQYLLLQDAPFYLTFSISSQKPIEGMLLDYIGLSITEPIGQGIQQNKLVSSFSFHVGGYDIVIPLSEKEAQIARSNQANLAQSSWQNTQITSTRRRIRWLFDGNEALSAFYLPINSEIDIQGLDTFTLDERPLPRELVDIKAGKDSNILIGKNRYFGFEQDVVIPEDTRRQHTYIIGQTGTGKTTLMKTMILSDMRAGNGLAVIDPHGELYRDILGMIPESRKQDVVLFDPSDDQYPVGFNLLEVKDEEEQEFIIKEVRAIMNRFLTEFFRINDGDMIGPIFFQHVQNNLLLTSSDKDSPGTIVEFYNIFEIPEFWQRWLPLQSKNRFLVNWVNKNLPTVNYDKIGYNGLRTGDYFSSKFVDFVNDPRINLIFGQPHSTIDLEEVVSKKKILLVNLSKGLLGEANSSLLGMMLMAKLNSVFMRRVKKTGSLKKISPYYLYVDEFQNIATENFSILLAEARKFGLGLILANQYTKQIKGFNMLDSIIGNVGTMISFRLGVEDAIQMSSQFFPHYDAQAMSELPNYQAILRTNVKGERTVPCNFKTILTPVSEEFADSSEVVELSRAKYATPKILAEFLVTSSLAEERMSKPEHYWEKAGIPRKQRLASLNWREILPLFYSNQKRVERAERFLNENAKRMIIQDLTYGQGVSKAIVARLLEKIESNDVMLVENMENYLKTIFKPELGENVKWVRGVYNQAVRQFILSKLSDLVSNSPEGSENPLVVDFNKAGSKIASLCSKELWLSACTEIALHWKLRSDHIEERGGGFGI